MSDTKEDVTAKIRELNDSFRTNLEGGKYYLTPGIIGRPDFWKILKAVKTYSEFDNGNDPHEEHDFGAFESDGDKIFWKIDYYDSDLQMMSPDPADTAVTCRVLTVMLASEY